MATPTTIRQTKLPPRAHYSGVQALVESLLNLEGALRWRATIPERGVGVKVLRQLRLGAAHLHAVKSTALIAKLDLQFATLIDAVAHVESCRRIWHLAP